MSPVEFGGLGWAGGQLMLGNIWVGYAHWLNALKQNMGESITVLACDNLSCMWIYTSFSAEYHVCVWMRFLAFQVLAVLQRFTMCFT